MIHQSISILIITAKNADSNQLISIFKSLGMNNINTSSSIGDGLTKIQKLNPDIIFLENNLPNTDGSSFLAEIKGISKTSKVILMSDDFHMNDIAAAIELGADYLIDKSNIDKEQFQKVINATIKAKDKSESVWSIMNLFKTKMPAPSKSIKTIAIVEDNELFAFYLSWTLNQLGMGYIVSTFTNGKDFVSFLDNTQPEYVFLDYYLPDSNGKQVLERIKLKSPHSIITVISSLDSPDKAIELKSIGVDHYIIKDKSLKENVKKLIKTLKL